MNIFWKVRLSQVRTGIFLSNGRKIVGRKITESNSGESFHLLASSFIVLEKGTFTAVNGVVRKSRLFLCVAVKM